VHDNIYLQARQRSTLAQDAHSTVQLLQSKTQFHFTAHSSPDINPIDSKTYGVIQYQLQVNNIEEIKQRLPETRQSSNIAFD